MTQRWTKQESDAFQRQWLTARMLCVWTMDRPIVCKYCGRKYSASVNPRRCRARRKPNRWRLHFRRAYIVARYGTADRAARRPTFNGPGILQQIHEIELSIRHQAERDDRWWKYAREARRYRRLMRAWWALPAAETTAALIGTDTKDATAAAFAGAMTRGRNKLFARVRAGDSRQITDGGCTYTFYPHATIHDASGRQVPLFAAAEPITTKHSHEIEATA